MIIIAAEFYIYLYLRISYRSLKYKIIPRNCNNFSSLPFHQKRKKVINELPRLSDKAYFFFFAHTQFN